MFQGLAARETRGQRLPAGSVTVSIYSQYIFQSHPGIDWNVRCNCREYTVQYTRLCYPDSIQGYNPIFQTKCLVKTKKENDYLKHVTIPIVKHSLLKSSFLQSACELLLSNTIQVSLIFFFLSGSGACVCLCLSGRREVGKPEERGVWRVGVDMALTPTVFRVSGREQW